MKKQFEKFKNIISESFEINEFLKITLSKRKNSLDDLKNVYIREIIIRKQRMLSFTFRYERRDEVKNFFLQEAWVQIENLLGNQFENADAFTSQNHYLYASSNDSLKISEINEKSDVSISKSHDKEKVRLINPVNNKYLNGLGISSLTGEIIKDKNAKWKQINRYIEIFAHLIKPLSLPSSLKISDMGCGKGYLTFALFDYLKQSGFAPSMTGVESRQDLIDFCNQLSDNSGMDGLQFVKSTIMDYDCKNLDILIALHACDTATDDAIFKGIFADAKVIITAPCCHKQVRKNMQNPDKLLPILKHGILKERMAETLTDTLRSLVLEGFGYEANVIEFISPEHTGKNLMITAIKQRETQWEKYLGKIDALMLEFGIMNFYLLDLVKKRFSSKETS